jgi:hypothetical protein
MNTSACSMILAERREALVRRAARERQQLGAALTPLRSLGRAFEWGLTVAGILRRQPWLLALPTAALMVWRRLRVGSARRR